MLVRTSKSVLRILGCAFALCACFLVSRTALAEDSIIRHPGDHTNYSVEIEPHLDIALFLPTAGSNGVGVGGRFTIPVVKNGFVPSINNSVGIGFGIDWLHYNGCFNYYFSPGYCSNLDSFWFPVVMQWNFFLSTHWSVFGEPGFAIAYENFGNYYGCFNGAGQPVPCAASPNRVVVEPVFFVGGRFQFSDSAALTLRIGWPYASLGISFMQ
jgi:hypothetical protein